MATGRASRKRRRVWRPRVRWQRKPQTQVVPNRKRQSRQDVKRMADRALEEPEEPREE